MHTLLTILGGLLLLVVFLLFGWLWGGAAGVPTAARLFVPAWAAVAAANLWVGVSRAGYGVAQELPILAVNVAVPVAAALLVSWSSVRS